MNKIKNKAYKIVRCLESGVLTSCVFSHSISYETDGSLIRPELGMIFIFLDLDDAQRYAKSVAYSQIWEVQAFCIEELEDRLDVTAMDRPGIFESFWTNYRDGQCHGTDKYYSAPVPTGSYGCKSLRMIKEVK